MKFSEKRPGNQGRPERNRWSSWRLFTAWIVALTVAAVILMTLGQSMTGADRHPPAGHGNTGEYPRLGRPRPRTVGTRPAARCV